MYVCMVVCVCVCVCVCMLACNTATFEQVAGSDTKKELLQPAHALAKTLTRARTAAVRQRQREKDALAVLERLVEEVEGGLSSDEAERLESRLQAFARTVAADVSADEAGAGGRETANSQGGVAAGLSVGERGRGQAVESALMDLQGTVQRGFAEVTLALARLESRAAARMGD